LEFVSSFDIRISNLESSSDIQFSQASDCQEMTHNL
jgi:hypothetical protein